MAALHTERLFLRPHEPEADTAALSSILGDPQAMEHIGHGAMSATEVADYVRRYAGLWQETGLGGWTIIRAEDHAVLGNIFLKRLRELPEMEVGYTFAPRFWGQGYAKEALNRVLCFAGQDRALTRLVALVRPVNTRSSGLLLRCGFELEALLPLRNKQLELYVTDPRATPSAQVE